MKIRAGEAGDSNVRLIIMIFFTFLQLWYFEGGPRGKCLQYLPTL